MSTSASVPEVIPRRRRAGKRLPIEELERRVDEVVGLILTGHRRSAIWHHVSQNTLWGVSERTVVRYIERAHARIREETAADHAQLRATHRARLELVYRRSLEAGNLRAANRALDSLARLDGLEPPRKLHVDVEGDVNLHVKRPPTLDQRAAIIRDLFGLAARRAAEAEAKRTGSNN